MLLASCSEGDRNPWFIRCVDHCSRTGCTEVPGQAKDCNTICNTLSPLDLAASRWDCNADCKYHCMWQVEEARQAQGNHEVYKYYGKWPFTRVLGMQEMASVVFSLLNLAAHAHNLHRFTAQHKLLRKQTKANYPFLYIWIIYSLISINAWVASAIFHTRDTSVTEKLDYFSADALVMCSSVTALIHIFSITTPLKTVLLVLLALAALLRHYYYMLFVRFDYGYNMQVCIVLGISQALLWLAWCIQIKHPHRQMLYKFLACIHVAMLLEVLDFPPIWNLFDAHSVWHAATVGIIYLWYGFLLGDMQWQMQQHMSGAGTGNH